jgi:anti-sigma regulatory factor (Ser/Thr protein kinase)
MEQKEIRLIIDSDLKNVSLVGKAVKELCTLVSRALISPDDMELCVVEAVNNCIEHAYGKEKGHRVEVDFSLGRDRLVVDICDTGKPMDARLLEQSNSAILEMDQDHLDAIAEQGRGLPIIREIMDSVVYETKSGKNRLSLTKFFA